MPDAQWTVVRHICMDCRAELRPDSIEPWTGRDVAVNHGICDACFSKRVSVEPDELPLDEGCTVELRGGELYLISVGRPTWVPPNFFWRVADE